MRCIVLALLFMGCAVETPPAEGSRQIGVPACDEYVQKVEVCMSRSARSRAMLAAGLDGQRREYLAWGEEAKTSSSRRAALEASCKSAAEALRDHPGCQ